MFNHTIITEKPGVGKTTNIKNIISVIKTFKPRQRKMAKSTSIIIKDDF